MCHSSNSHKLADPFHHVLRSDVNHFVFLHKLYLSRPHLITIYVQASHRLLQLQTHVSSLASSKICLSLVFVARVFLAYLKQFYTPKIIITLKLQHFPVWRRTFATMQSCEILKECFGIFQKICMNWELTIFRISAIKWEVWVLTIFNMRAYEAFLIVWFRFSDRVGHWGFLQKVRCIVEEIHRNF